MKSISILLLLCFLSNIYADIEPLRDCSEKSLFKNMDTFELLAKNGDVVKAYNGIASCGSLKTDDDDLIVIPVLINVKNYSLNTFPGFINFGLCDLAAYNRKNFVKMVPLLVMNYGNEDVEVKRIYLDYDDKFIHFHKKFKNQNKIIIKKNSHNQFGYILFDGEYAVDKDENKFIGKIQRGSVLIETNSTIDPLLEIEYFYLMVQ